MYNVENKVQQHQNMHPVKHTRKALLLGAQASLRVMAAATSLAAMCVMLTSEQTAVIFGIPVNARYSYSSAFRFSASVDGVTCAFCVLSLLLLFILSRQACNSCGHFVLFLHDLIMMSLMLAGCGAATAIGMVGMYGNSHTGWAPICDHLSKFCHGVTTSIILSLLSVLSLMMLTIISSYNYSRQLQM